MLAQHRKRAGSELAHVRRVVAFHLFLEVGDVLAMVFDHVAAEFVIEGCAVQALKLRILRLGLGSHFGRYRDVVPGGGGNGLLPSTLMVGLQHPAECPYLAALAPRRCEGPQFRFGIVALDRLGQEFRRARAGLTRAGEEK